MTNVWRRWLAAHERVRDAIPAVVLVVLAVPGTAVGSAGWHPPRPGGIALVVLAGVPLVFRSRWPIPVAAVTVAADLVYVAVSAEIGLVPGASLIALYTVATHSDRRTAWIVGGTAALCVVVTTRFARPDPPQSVGNLALFDLMIAATALGDTVRSRRAHLAAVEERAAHAERTREQEASRRVTEERIRIARDLHDVVAHHITLVNAQAGVAQHLVRTDAEKAYQALGHIKETSRAALDELRATVGLLRQAEDPPVSREPIPGLDDLERLIDSFRQAGLPVDLKHTGQRPDLTSAAELTAYRIVQEALTNAHKHAGSAPAHVVLDYLPDTLRIAVTDDGRPAPRGNVPGTGTGHGLIGMRERAAAVGGTMSAGPMAEGGFRVLAELPAAPRPNGER